MNNGLALEYIMAASNKSYCYPLGLIHSCLSVEPWREWGRYHMLASSVASSLTDDNLKLKVLWDSNLCWLIRVVDGGAYSCKNLDLAKNVSHWGVNCEKQSAIEPKYPCMFSLSMPRIHFSACSSSGPFLKFVFASLWAILRDDVMSPPGKRAGLLPLTTQVLNLSVPLL